MDGRGATTYLPAAAQGPQAPECTRTAAGGKARDGALVSPLLRSFAHTASVFPEWIMWRNRKRTARRLGAFLDEGSEIEGKYICTGTVMLDAKLRGEIMSRDTLIIGDQGVVHATVQAATVVVRGEVVGNVTASERVELKGSARVTGDVEAPVIVMEAGAVLEGHCRMAKPKPSEAPLTLVVPLKA